MFQAIARIPTRHLALQPLVNAEHDVDGCVAIRVRTDLPAGRMGSARVLVQFFLGVHQDAVIIGPAHVRLGQTRRSL